MFRAIAGGQGFSERNKEVRRIGSAASRGDEPWLCVRYDTRHPSGLELCFSCRCPSSKSLGRNMYEVQITRMIAFLAAGVKMVAREQMEWIISGRGPASAVAPRPLAYALFNVSRRSPQLHYGKVPVQIGPRSAPRQHEFRAPRDRFGEQEDS